MAIMSFIYKTAIHVIQHLFHPGDNATHTRDRRLGYDQQCNKDSFNPHLAHLQCRCSPQSNLEERDDKSPQRTWPIVDGLPHRLDCRASFQKWGRYLDTFISWRC